MNELVSYWLVNKYFIKCNNCKYEIIIGSRHSAPRQCPKCGYIMRGVMKCF